MDYYKHEESGRIYRFDAEKDIWWRYTANGWWECDMSRTNLSPCPQVLKDMKIIKPDELSLETGVF